MLLSVDGCDHFALCICTPEAPLDFFRVFILPTHEHVGRSMFFCLLLEFWMRCTHACRNFGRWNLKGKVWSLSSRWSILPSPLILGPVSLCGQYLTNVRMHLQVNYVRPAPTVLRLDPMQITAKTETKISLYMKYLAPVSIVSQVSIKSSRACNTSHNTSMNFAQTHVLLIFCIIVFWRRFVIFCNSLRSWLMEKVPPNQMLNCNFRMRYTPLSRSLRTQSLQGAWRL